MNVNISVEIETCIARNLRFITMYVNADHKHESHAPQLNEGKKKEWKKRAVCYLRIGVSPSIAS